MSSDVVYTAIHDFLVAQFTAAPLVFENESSFQTPEPPSPWVMVEVYGYMFEQVSTGSGTPIQDKWREEGAVICHVMCPVNTGSLAGRQMAAQIAELFRGRRLEPDIRFADLSIGSGMVQIDDGNWWPISLRAEWARDTA